MKNAAVDMAPSCYDDDVKHTSIWNQEEASVDASVVTDWLPHKPNLDHKNSDHIVVQGLGDPSTPFSIGSGRKVFYVSTMCLSLVCLWAVATRIDLSLSLSLSLSLYIYIYIYIYIHIYIYIYMVLQELRPGEARKSAGSRGGCSRAEVIIMTTIIIIIIIIYE